ncbi:hypothetical protein [Arenibaculum pallidiluteum]|uniref:hypothetical protein n=1 Tax=Arenibaculum pallidiluteum TaxID=2812559 RepID=UPI001A95C740|nr:hypothetical protein [Arenibaculum pallidiluteum]
MSDQRHVQDMPDDGTGEHEGRPGPGPGQRIVGPEDEKRGPDESNPLNSDD